MKLSILICSLEERKDSLTNLLLNLMLQCKSFEFNSSVIERLGTLTITTYSYDRLEIITAMDNRIISTGEKRNILYQRAKGNFSISVDDDDEIPDYYICELLEAADNDVDCFAMNGTITTNGKDEKKWYISKDLGYTQVGVGNKAYYLRYPNHITAIKSEITKRFLFPHINHGEDFDWATQIHKSGLIKTEVQILKPIYHYKYRNPK